MTPCSILIGIPIWSMFTIKIKSLPRMGALVFLILGMPVWCGAVVTRREAILQQIPSWVRPSSMSEVYDIHTEHGDEQITAKLYKGELVLTSDNELYRTDEEWITVDFFVFDLDHDNYDEVMLHVWKPGSFGDFQPIWMENDNSDEYSEHLFIYEWDMNRSDRLDPIWMSSAMPVKGQQIIIEDEGVIRIHAPDGSETRWCWESWGLVFMD